MVMSANSPTGDRPRVSRFAARKTPYDGGCGSLMDHEEMEDFPSSITNVVDESLQT
jgi:hypothetical protein